MIILIQLTFHSKDFQLLLNGNIIGLLNSHFECDKPANEINFFLYDGLQFSERELYHIQFPVHIITSTWYTVNYI